MELDMKYSTSYIQHTYNTPLKYIYLELPPYKNFCGHPCLCDVMCIVSQYKISIHYAYPIIESLEEI